MYHWAVTSMNSMLIEFGAPTLLNGYDIIFTQSKDHELQIPILSRYYLP